MTKAFVVMAFAGGICCAQTYNVTTQWSNTLNPNGTWSYDQGTTPLPFQANLGTGTCYNTVTGITGGWAPGINMGDEPPCLPAFILTTGNAGGVASPTLDWQAGDVLMASQDPTNGAGEGQAQLIWTSPSAGTITVSGKIWYAMSFFARSNDYFLTLGGSTLASGTVTTPNNRTNMTGISAGPVGVSPGSQLILLVQRSSGQAFSAYSGVQMNIVLTPGAPTTPAPPTLILTLTALVAMGCWFYWVRRRRPGTL